MPRATHGCPRHDGGRPGTGLLRHGGPPGAGPLRTGGLAVPGSLRAGGPVLAALTAVLLVLLGPALAPAAAHHGTAARTTTTADEVIRADGAVRGDGAVRADAVTRADGSDPGVRAGQVRGPRDAPREIHVPLVGRAPATPYAVPALPPGLLTPPSAPAAPASEQAGGRHQGRAPPLPSGS